LPVASSMLENAARIRPRRDGGELFQRYYLYWTAFNNIYTVIAGRKGLQFRIKKQDNGSIITFPNGNVNIPAVETISEKKQIHLVIPEMETEFKHALILHESTRYFVNRIPFWQGRQVESDAFGQRLNGVINVKYTSDSRYPIWSPIDVKYYREYLEKPDDDDKRDFLTGQVLDLLYTVRNNLMHGGKALDDSNDLDVMRNALPLLELIVDYFIY